MARTEDAKTGLGGVVALLVGVLALPALAMLGTLAALVAHPERLGGPEGEDSLSAVGFDNGAFYVGVSRVAAGRTQWLRSSDNGATWTASPTPDLSAFQQTHPSEETWMACAHDGTCYQVSNPRLRPDVQDPTSFTRRIERMPPGSDPIEEAAIGYGQTFLGVAVDINNSDHAIAITSGGHVYYRLSNGQWGTLDVKALADSLQ